MKTLSVDIVSDVVCPWCAIGYERLERAMQALEGEIAFKIAWHPFELNPDMPPEGEEMGAHLARKYGIDREAAALNRQRIAEIGQSLGLRFATGEGRRIYNTFAAHRVLAWAREQGRQDVFNQALFEAYFAEGENPSDPEVLRRVADGLGLDGEQAAQIARTDRYAEAVRREERQYLEAGISAVPAYIVEQRYLISGGQEPDTFIKAFRSIAAELG